MRKRFLVIQTMESSLYKFISYKSLAKDNLVCQRDNLFLIKLMIILTQIGIKIRKPTHFKTTRVVHLQYILLRKTFHKIQ